MAGRGKTKRQDRGKLLALLLVVVGLLFLCWPRTGGKILIYNPTPSVPVGFYLRDGAAPGKGRLVLFRVPDVVREYSKTHYDKEPLKYFLKPVIGGGGDKVCYQDDVFTINGHEFGNATKQDREGHDLPIWTECRTLAGDEFFVFSDRVSHSFDSRHYGPVSRSTILGVFRPLWVNEE